MQRRTIVGTLGLVGLVLFTILALAAMRPRTTGGLVAQCKDGVSDAACGFWSALNSQFAATPGGPESAPFPPRSAARIRQPIVLTAEQSEQLWGWMTERLAPETSAAFRALRPGKIEPVTVTPEAGEVFLRFVADNRGTGSVAGRFPAYNRALSADTPAIFLKVDVPPPDNDEPPPTCSAGCGCLRGLNWWTCALLGTPCCEINAPGPLDPIATAFQPKAKCPAKKASGMTPEERAAEIWTRMIQELNPDTVVVLKAMLPKGLEPKVLNLEERRALLRFVGDNLLGGRPMDGPIASVTFDGVILNRGK